MPSLFNAAMLGLGLVATASATPTKTKSCDQATVTVTIATHTVVADETIFSIANKYSVGACDLARYNVMADAVLIYVGEELLVPEQVCAKDSTSCIVANKTYSAECIYGGPHVYTTELNDSLDYIAAKLEIDVGALSAGVLPDSGITSNSSIIPEGDSLKVPQCSPSVCDVIPFQFTYGVYKDLAEKYGTTVGQIQAFNNQYNHSTSGNDGSGPTITLPTNCRALSKDITIIS